MLSNEDIVSKLLNLIYYINSKNVIEEIFENVVIIITVKHC